MNQVGYHSGLAVTAYGTTASERRRSRMELWQHSGQLLYGTPQAQPRRGKQLGFCFTTEGVRRYLGGQQRVFLTDMLAQLAGHPNIDTGYLSSFVEGTVMESISAPTNAQVAARQGYLPGRESSWSAQHGLALRLFLPYADARITEARINGHIAAESPSDGFQIKRETGTVVQYNIPPDKVADVHLVTCAYETDTRRDDGFRPEDW